MITVRCEGCKAELKVPPSAAGRRLTCPGCNAELPIPATAALSTFAAPWVPATPSVLTGGSTLRGSMGGPPLLKPKPKPADFYRQLNSAFRYPFSSGGGIAFFIVLSVFWGLTKLIVFYPINLLVQIGTFGFIACYLWSVFQDTVRGQHVAPGGPDLSEPWELVIEWFRFIMASVACYWPVGVLFVVGLVRFGLEIPDSYVSLLWVVGVAGIFYYPMALMLISYSNAATGGLHYLLGAQSIRRTFRAYGVCLLYMLGAWVGSYLLQTKVTSELLTGWLMLIPVLIITHAIQLYMFILGMRAVGLLYWSHQEQLGWGTYRKT